MTMPTQEEFPSAPPPDCSYFTSNNHHPADISTDEGSLRAIDSSIDTVSSVTASNNFQQDASLNLGHNSNETQPADENNLHSSQHSHYTSVSDNSCRRSEGEVQHQNYGTVSNPTETSALNSSVNDSQRHHSARNQRLEIFMRTDDLMSTTSTIASDDEEAISGITAIRRNASRSDSRSTRKF